MVKGAEGNGETPVGLVGQVGPHGTRAVSRSP